MFQFDFNNGHMVIHPVTQDDNNQKMYLNFFWDEVGFYPIEFTDIPF